MNILTAEKCREMIDIFKSLEKEDHLALASEYHLQAYEKALPVLEQQESQCQKCAGTGLADSGGTQPWGEPIPIECDCQFEQQEKAAISPTPNHAQCCANAGGDIDICDCVNKDWVYLAPPQTKTYRQLDNAKAQDKATGKHQEGE